MKWERLGAVDLFKSRAKVTYLVDRVLSDIGLHVFYGDAGSKKSFSLLDIALCVASGEKWLDEFETQQTTVLWLDKENGEEIMVERFKALANSHGLTEKELEGNFYYYPFPDATLDYRNRQGAKDTLHTLMVEIEDTHAGLVIIDNLSSISGTIDQNGNLLQTVTQPLLEIAKKQKIVIILVHHSTKANHRNERGSGTIRASADTMICVESKTGDNAIIFTTPGKVRRLPVNIKAMFSTQSNSNDDLISTTLSYVGESESRIDNKELFKRFIFLLHDNPGFNQSKIANGLPIGRNKVLNQLDFMVNAGFLEQTKGSHNSKRYQLTAKGEGKYSNYEHENVEKELLDLVV